MVTDANGREQRATHTISLKCDKALPKQKLEVAKEIFVTGEKILARLTTEDGKAPEGATSLVVMKLSPAPLGGYVDYGYGYSDYNYYGRGALRPLPAAAGGTPSRRRSRPSARWSPPCRCGTTRPR